MPSRWVALVIACRLVSALSTKEGLLEELFLVILAFPCLHFPSDEAVVYNWPVASAWTPSN